jgi:hypothetical protein
MIKQISLYLILLNVCLAIAPAQEVVTGLQSNYSITESKNNKKRTDTKAGSDNLELPFFDDFSGQSVFPEKMKWLDNYVFINNTYSDRQITKGIATFDALDNSGNLYTTASSTGFKADLLTSQPLNLNYLPSDNIWLSFYYQAGGLADIPEANDSLTLQFLAPDENKWYSVWKAGGNTEPEFKPVIMRIDKTRFLKKGFQFRFINYASLSQNMGDPSMVGNCDIWNIDYVLIDKNRDAADTIFADVAFRLPLRSLLLNYEAMPWKQFRQIYLQQMGSSIPVNYRNNDIITRNVTRNFEIWDVYKNSMAHFFSAGATNIPPLTNIAYNADLIYTFNTDNNDSALFRITCSLKTDAFDPKGNDTLVYYQIFKNYFAFDDGSSEGGYGINGLGSRNAMFAYRFKSYMTDTLRSVSICFNDSYLDANKRAFDLMVWNDDNGIPGNVLFTKEEIMVEQGTVINGFYTYNIPDGVEVKDIFYIGWKQRSETFLNAGFDVNTPHAGRQFYWLNGEWQQSQVHGSVMIRAVVGDRLKLTSINEMYLRNKNLINVWPNPTKNYVNIDPGEMQLSGLSYITVMDLSGREIIKVPFSEQIDISSLHEGMYIIITTMNGRPIGYNRLIKTR